LLVAGEDVDDLGLAQERVVDREVVNPRNAEHVPHALAREHADNPLAAGRRAHLVTWGAPPWPPTPPHARRAPSESWRSSGSRSAIWGAPTWPPTPPNARRVPSESGRSSGTRELIASLARCGRWRRRRGRGRDDRARAGAPRAAPRACRRARRVRPSSARARCSRSRARPDPCHETRRAW